MRVYELDSSYCQEIYLLLVCVWEDQSKNQYYICHKASSVLYGKYSTVVKNTVQLF